MSESSVLIGFLLSSFGLFFVALYPDFALTTIKRFYRVIVDLPGLCLRCTFYGFGLHLIPAKHRKHLHWGILLVIAGDLVWAGVRLADFGFLMLAALMEGEETHTHAPSLQGASAAPLDPSPYQIDADYLDSQGKLSPVKETAYDLDRETVNTELAIERMEGEGGPACCPEEGSESTIDPLDPTFGKGGYLS